MEVEADPFVPLQECDDLKQVLGVRIPRRAKHAHQGGAGLQACIKAGQKICGLQPLRYFRQRQPCCAMA